MTEIDDHDFIERESLYIAEQLPVLIRDFIRPELVRDLNLMLDDSQIDHLYTDIVDLIAVNTAKANLKDRKENIGDDGCISGNHQWVDGYFYNDHILRSIFNE